MTVAEHQEAIVEHQDYIRSLNEDVDKHKASINEHRAAIKKVAMEVCEHEWARLPFHEHTELCSKCHNTRRV